MFDLIPTLSEFFNRRWKKVRLKIVPLYVEYLLRTLKENFKFIQLDHIRFVIIDKIGAFVWLL